MKYVILIFVILIAGCAGDMKSELPKSDKITRVANGEYINIDDETVRIFFRGPEDARFVIKYGRDNNMSNQITGINKNNYADIKGLVHGESYFYQIFLEKAGKSVTSKVLKLSKITPRKIERASSWARNGVFYEIFVRSFYDTDNNGIGDFNGISKKSQYLKELGVNCVWLMPINESVSYHGYDVTDYYKTEYDYGTMTEFENMVNTLHNKGIKVVIDLVINHTSSRHNWFNDNNYKDYYFWSDQYTDTSKSGEWGQDMWYSGKNGEYQGVFSSVMPDLNFRNPEVRNEIKQVAKFWIEKGVDGFRLDASKHIDDDSFVTHSWWKEFANYVKSLDEEFYLVGENWDNDAEKIAPFLEEFDSTFNFNIADKILDAANGERVDIAKELNMVYEIYNSVNENYIDAVFIRNHDMARIYEELNGDTKKMKMAASILLTLPGAPFIYYGEEIGMKGGKPDENIRGPFEWYKKGSGNGMAYWRTGTIDADDGISLEEEENNSVSLYSHYKKLLKIRDEYRDCFGKITGGIDGDGMIHYILEGNNKKIEVYHNNSSTQKIIRGKEIRKELLSDKNGKDFVVQPWSSIILGEH